MIKQFISFSHVENNLGIDLVYNNICSKLFKQKNSIKKAQFRVVLQEMYSRRNLDKGKKDGSRNRSQAEVNVVAVCCGSI